uniref:Putative disease resistance protein RGA3 n=1 Tax=Rhizophora mucronata TaxID=61149 RepID=A0A2P2MJJ9_RHIMU
MSLMILRKCWTIGKL